ncbi:hypothetical protein [Methylobacter sp.]
MMELTAKNVEAVLFDCLFGDDDKEMSNAVMAEGIIHTFALHPERLEKRKEDIRHMLDCLPDNFKESVGGGWSFLQACMTKDGVHWGEHRDMERLFALGIATGQVKQLVPRARWAGLPGGMPYYAVCDQ